MKGNRLIVGLWVLVVLGVTLGMWAGAPSAAHSTGPLARPGAQRIHTGREPTSTRPQHGPSSPSSVGPTEPVAATDSVPQSARAVEPTTTTTTVPPVVVPTRAGSVQDLASVGQQLDSSDLAAPPSAPPVSPPPLAGPLAPCTRSLRAGLLPSSSMAVGDCLTVGSFALTLEPSGQLVATDNGDPFWAQPAPGSAVAGSQVVLQGGGTLAMVSPSGDTTWSHSGPGGACLMGMSTLGTVGDIVVDQPGDRIGIWPLWSLVPCYAGGPTGSPVAVIGDSITLVAQPDIVSAIGARHPVQVSGMVGFTFARQAPSTAALLSDPAGPPADVIVNLGTNDVLQSNPDWQVGMSAVLSQIPSQDCAVLVTVSDTADRTSPRASDVNAALEQWASGRSRTAVVDWNAMLEQGGHAQQWLTDGIHPNAEGDTVLAAALASAVDQHC